MLEGAELCFNVDHGYLEGLVRGCKAGLLTQQDYVNLVQCETLEGKCCSSHHFKKEKGLDATRWNLKIHLQTTDYGNFLANQTSPLTVSTIDTEMRKKLCREFEYFWNHSLEPLSTFFTYMTCSYMIDNVILLMNGALQKKSVKEMLVKCHPLGRFTEMEAVNIAETPSELFNAILVETPLAPFFQDCMSENTLDELNIEILRNKLYKFEADRRAFIITLNSFGTELSKEDRETLYPTCGKLYPEGLRLLAQAEDFEQMKRVADHYGVYKPLFEAVGDGSGAKTLEDVFYEREGPSADRSAGPKELAPHVQPLVREAPSPTCPCRQLLSATLFESWMPGDTNIVHFSPMVSAVREELAIRLFRSSKTRVGFEIRCDVKSYCGQGQTFLWQLCSRAAGLKRLDAVLSEEQGSTGRQPWPQKQGCPEIQERDQVAETSLEKMVVSSTAWEGHTHLSRAEGGHSGQQSAAGPGTQGEPPFAQDFGTPPGPQKCLLR
ncbi:V-type proton ATPase subunit d 2 [Camelus ferus]|nr:V-type proton ATPase subunit d 2 [Camelus ferus]